MMGEVLRLLHEGHQGIVKMKARLRTRERNGGENFISFLHTGARHMLVPELLLLSSCLVES